MVKKVMSFFIVILLFEINHERFNINSNRINDLCFLISAIDAHNIKMQISHHMYMKMQCFEV